MNKLTPPTEEQDEDPHLSTTPSEQDEEDPFDSMTPEQQKEWAHKIGDFARSKLMNADGSLKPATSDLQRNVPAPQLKVVK